MAIAWGTFPDWFAAVGVVGAFGATWWVILQNGRLQRQQQDEASWDEAYRIRIGTAATYGSEDHGSPQLLEVSVTNNGKRPIFDVKIDATYQGVPIGRRQIIYKVPPEQTASTFMRWEDDAFDREVFRGSITAHFEDFSGGTWRIDNEHYLDPISRPPRRKSKAHSTGDVIMPPQA